MARIMVVDPDQITGAETARILRAENHALDLCSSIETALERVMNQEYDLVITELSRSAEAESCVERFKQLRQTEDVIILTGSAGLESVISCMRAGAADYLVKPCSAEHLRQSVKKALARRALSRENYLLRALNEMKDKFLTLVSHELRTPLTLVYGYLAILQNQGNSTVGEQMPLLRTMMRAVHQLVQIVNNIQTVIQAENGEMALHLQPVKLDSLLSEIVAGMKANCPDRRVNLHMANDMKWLGFLLADSIRLRQALMELVQNALRATPDGGEIEVGAVRENDQMRIWVQDNGVGIPLDQQGKVFEQFYEVEDVRQHQSGATAFKSGGIGLGLSLVKAVVEAHHGSIHMQSEPNFGTRFEIILPAARDAADETFPDREEQIAEPPACDQQDIRVNL